MMLPFAAMWSEGGQDVLRSADDVVVRIDESEEELWVWGHSAASTTPPSDRRLIEIVIESADEVEQVCSAVVQAKGLRGDLKVIRNGIVTVS